MYIVLESADLEKLVAQVNEYLKTGWKCTGGICSAVKMTTWHSYMQAMIKE